MNGKKEFGDYQTPIEFADKVCDYLLKIKAIKPDIVIEPTCGLGNFLQSSLVFHAEKYIGIEINHEYCAACKQKFQNKPVEIINADLFNFSLGSLRSKKKSILLIGNPPWVTNGMLSSIGSCNLPEKNNFKGFRGVEAITGTSNFDICEYFILKIIREFQNTNTVIAMLCKTSVARNVFSEIMRTNTNCCACDILQFDSKEVFGINASACVLVIQLCSTTTTANACKVFSLDHPSLCIDEIKYINGSLISCQVKKCTDYSGKCCFEWRQGVKHDCSSVMELTKTEDHFFNGFGECVDIEDTMLFPLVKSSMFKNPIIHSFSKYVIVTQKKPRDNTNPIADIAPKTWLYLNSHKGSFDARKSTIYFGAPPFSMFGIGDYSFARYKVGLSGFYKKPLFCLLYSDDAKPVMTDDTGYFIGFDDYDMAYAALLILNSSKVQQFIMCSSFLDSKRPFTKKLLNRIDFSKVLDDCSFGILQKTERSLGLAPYITIEMLSNFSDFIKMGQQTIPLEFLLNYG